VDTDLELLRRYSRDRDPKSFARLARRYAGYVFGICLRITGSRHDAEDVTQECFLQLARNAAAIDSSLVGWLHTVATRRSVNTIRSAATRRRHEARAAANRAGADGPTWAEIAPHVDRALEEMPGPLRIPLILHYMQGRGQSEIASELGISQSTVSRRLERGVAVLRGKLSRAGVVAPAVAIGVLLMENTVSVAPATLLGSLGKMAMTGVGEAASAASAAPTASAVTTTGLGALKAKAALAVAVGVVAVGGVVAYRQMAEPDPAPAPVAAALEAEAAEDVAPVFERVWVDIEGLGGQKGMPSLRPGIGFPSGTGSAGATSEGAVWRSRAREAASTSP